MELAQAAPLKFPDSKSNVESVALPVEDIVIKSIFVLYTGPYAPAIKPLVLDAQVNGLLPLTVKSPKSCEFPVVEIVTYSQTFSNPGLPLPPAKTPRAPPV